MQSMQLSRRVAAVQKSLFQLYWALERRIVPGLESSQYAYARIVKQQVTGTTRWLDLGCGHQLWPEWIPGQPETARTAALLVGLDPDKDSLQANNIVHHRVVGLQLPFRDGSFNLITANMVFEHLEDPVQVLREIRRVLSPNGVCIFHTSNARFWQVALARHLPQAVKNALVHLSEGREAKDVYPTHYRINTTGEIPMLLQRAGFTSDRVISLNTSSAGRILLLGPFVLLELLWIRLTQRAAFSHYRSNIIAVIRPTPDPIGVGVDVRRSAAQT
jgi:ubiquinone/menaquinone biosynthesis C-methylase UbiE